MIKAATKPINILQFTWNQIGDGEERFRRQQRRRGSSWDATDLPTTAQDRARLNGYDGSDGGEQREMDSVMFRLRRMAMAAWLGLEQRRDELTGELPGFDGSNRDGERRPGWIATSTNRRKSCELRKSREGDCCKN